MGGRTVVLYLFTTVLAVSLGLVMVNIVRPGDGFSDEMRQEFKTTFMQSMKSMLSQVSFPNKRFKIGEFFGIDIIED